MPAVTDSKAGNAKIEDEGAAGKKDGQRDLIAASLEREPRAYTL